MNGSYTFTGDIICLFSRDEIDSRGKRRFVDMLPAQEEMGCYYPEEYRSSVFAARLVLHPGKERILNF